MKQVFLFLAILFLVGFLYADDHIAASLSQADIQTAVDAADAGDTVQLPSGTNNDFTGTVTISKAITVYGAGETTTVLKRASDPGDHASFFHVDPLESADQTITFHDFGLYGYGHTDDETIDEGIWLDYSGETDYEIRIYNCQFREFGYAGIRTLGYWYGCIYDCDFIDNDVTGYGYGVAVGGLTAPGDGGDNSWTRGHTLGSEFFIFVEDCYGENNRHFTTNSYGGRVVTRYNTITTDYVNARAIDAAHGYNFSTGERAGLCYEIYENEITGTGSASAGIGLNGGNGVIWENSAINAINLTYLHITVTLDDPPDAYPSQDQATDLYLWNNHTDYSETDWEDIDGSYGLLNSEPTYLVEGRDFYRYQKPGYSPYTYPHPLQGEAGTHKLILGSGTIFIIGPGVKVVIK